MSSMRATKKSREDMRGMSRGLRGFYRDQNEIIDMMEAADERILSARQQTSPPSPVSVVDGNNINNNNNNNVPALSPAVDDETDARTSSSTPIWLVSAKAARMAVVTSFAVNVLLFALKLVIFLASGSLTVLASTIDSALDLFSGAILFVTQRMMRRPDLHKYPVGKMRYENLGVIVFASVMATASLQVFIQSAQSLIAGEATPDIEPLVLIILGCVVGAKLALMIWCRALSRFSTSCEALAQDHRNDVLTNTFTLASMLVLRYGGSGMWWFDPVGAILFSLFILFNWASTARVHLTMMAGKSADRSVIWQLTYFAAQFHPLIQQVDTVRAYHSGLKLIVEVDIILPPETTLREAHDVGESLQTGLETLDTVQRAFVHIDWESHHSASDEHKPLL